MTQRKRLDRNVRQGQILDAAVKMAATEGFTNITRDGIAERAGCATGTVSKYFNTMNQLRRAVMRFAVTAAKDGSRETHTLSIIAQGIVTRDNEALKAPQEVKEAALKTSI